MFGGWQAGATGPHAFHHSAGSPEFLRSDHRVSSQIKAEATGSLDA